MGTPFPGLQHRDGGGGVAVMAGPVKARKPTPSKTCLKNSSLKPPILIFLFFHKAICSELERLHHAVVTFATTNGDIKPLFDCYHFLQAIYKHHGNAKDEVCFVILWISFRLEMFFFFFCRLNNMNFLSVFVYLVVSLNKIDYPFGCVFKSKTSFCD